MPAEEGDSPCQAASSGGVSSLDGHQGVGQPVPDRLELADRPPELGPLQRVDPGQFEHGPGGADQLVGDGQPGPRHRRRPLPRAELVAHHVRRPLRHHHLHQSEARVHASDRPTGQIGDLHLGHQLALVGAGHHEDGVLVVRSTASTPRGPPSGLPTPPPAGRPGPGEAGPRSRRNGRWGPVSNRSPARGPTSWCWSPPGARTERRRPFVGRPPAPRATRSARGRRRGPDRCGRRRPGEGFFEQGALLAVHQLSGPRSSKRRAMMFRWISAVPP